MEKAVGISQPILSFCSLICPGKTPVFVSVHPQAWCREMFCLKNVEEKVGRSGGNAIYGWRIIEVPKIYLEAQFHAVWLSPSRIFVDITPQASYPSQILFLEDESQKANTGNTPANRRVPLQKSKEVDRYFVLHDTYTHGMALLKEQGYPSGHPIYKERFGSQFLEAQAILDKLKNAP